jgi:hypothetical protein
MPDLMAVPWIAEMGYYLKSAGISTRSKPAVFSKSARQNHRLPVIYHPGQG